MSEKNRVFRQIAERYIETYGAELQKEAAELQQNGIHYDTAALDTRFRRAKHAYRTKRFAASFGIFAAACVALFLLYPIGTNFSDSTLGVPPENVQTYETIPLSFALPGNFTVGDVKQDYAKSVYLLSDTHGDDVVLTLEPYTDGGVYQSLRALTVGTHGAYGYIGSDYSLLTFDRDNVLYTLTCRHDIRTLVGLGEAIL